MRKILSPLLSFGIVALLLTPVTSVAQFLGQGPANPLKEISTIKLPAGSKVAIVVFEDLGCPACAHAHPYELEAAKKASVPLLRFDFPIASHIWTFDAALNARYLQDKVSPELAGEYRSDVFAAQSGITSKDDLRQFTEHWFQKHNQKMPFVIDQDGSLVKKVQADYDLGRRINLQYTPTILVVTKDQYQVICGVKDGANDPTQILPVVEAALSKTHNTPAHSHGSAPKT